MHDVLTITHSAQDGTLIDGTSRGDGAAEVLKAHGWRWHRDCGWYVRGSRGKLPRTALVDQTAQALRAAGFPVEVHLDTDPADPAELEARAAQRAQQLGERAAKAEQVSEARHQAAHQIADGIPLGQPILVGHHSEARHRRDLQRIDNHERKAHEAGQAAALLRQRAAHAASHAQPVNRVTLGNRIAALEADERRDERALARLADPDGRAARTITERLERTRTQLAYERSQWDARVPAGEFVAYGPATVKAGDLVQVSNLWRRVAKVNAKSCAVETGYSWTDRVPWHKVTDHRSGSPT